MSLKVTPEIFKWLQSLSLVKQAKRNNDLLQLPEEISLKFFDGNHIALILKNHFAHVLDEQALKKIQSLKQNSNPAIRLYNWNILGEILKKVKGAVLDSGEKSRLLGLESEPLLKILKALFESRSKPANGQKKGLKVQISQIQKKPLHQASNSMQFLIMALSKNFKLSPQHTLNLFLDNNKYLSHLLVKGVKNNFQPIYDFLNEIKSNLDFLVSQIFCLDEEENVGFFFNALKSCTISKDENTIWECLELWMEIGVTYKMKGISMKFTKGWVKNEGVNTLFFTLSKNPQYFQKIIELCYLYMDSELFEFFQLSQKSILWNSDKQKLTIFRRFISMQSQQLVQKFTSTQYLQDWLKHLIKISKKIKQPQEFYDMDVIFESLWLVMGERFEDEKYSLVNTYMQVLKQSFSVKPFVNFLTVSTSLFNLIKVLGTKKNIYAPQLYKIALTAFSNLTSNQQDKITFFCQNLLYSIKQIKNLPGGALVPVIIKFLSIAPNPSLLELCKVLFEEKRINQQQTIEMLQILTKIIFQDVVYSETAVEIVFEFIPSMSDQIADEYLTSNSKLSLSNFVSQAKGITKTVKQLRVQVEQQHKIYKEQENLRAKDQLSNNLKRFLFINNSIQYLQKYLEIDDINLRNSLQAMLFHTYIKVKVELKKKKVADFLMPLMKVYYENDQQLDNQISQFEKQNYPEQDANKQQSASKITLLKSLRRRKSLELSSLETSMQFKTIDPSTLKPSEFALKDLETLRQKREHVKTIQIQKEKQTIESESKLRQIKNLMNQRRVIEFGANGKVDFDYKNLYDFDVMKEEEIVAGIPAIRLVNFEKQEEVTYQDDLRNVMKKYRKVWRFLFFKYTSFGAKKQEFKSEQKINMAEIWKMLRQYDVFLFIKKEESQIIIKIINDNMKRKNDPQCLTYPGFEEYIAQICAYAYGKSSHPHLPPGRQVFLFIEQLKKSTRQKGGSIQLFQNPEDIYFQQTDVIRQYNKRLKQNPDYILPEGYKKYKQSNLEYEYSIHPLIQKNIKTSYVEVYEVLHQILYEKIGISLIEPLSLKNQITLAKPVLFQNLSQKMKEYKKGYLQPKSTIQVKDEKSVELRKSIVIKKQFKPHINFSLGIKLGLSSVSIKNKTVAQEVAYWMHDMLNAIQNDSLKVENTAKKKVDNVIFKRRRVQSLQKIKKQRSQKKQWKKRAESVKVRLDMQKKLKQQQNNKKKELEIQQKRKKRAREEQSLKMKLSRFEQMKKVISQRKEQAKYKKIEEDDKKKQRLQEYRQKVAEYFEKKKQEILQKQEEIKKQKQEKQKQEEQQKEKQSKFVKQLYMANLKKEEDVLEKADQLKEKYEELWQSEQIIDQLKKSGTELLYLFNLLVKHEKSKISSTSFDQIGLNTLHFFALRFMLIPFMVEKTELIRIFNFVIKEKQKRAEKQNDEKGMQQIQLTAGKSVKSPGLNFNNFQQVLFLIAIKAKKLLNEIKEKRSKRMQKLLQFVKERKSQDGNHFDVQDMSDSQEDEDEQDEEEEQKAPGLLEEYLFNVENVDEQTLRQVFVFLNLPKDRLGVEERYRAAVQSKNLKPKNILRAELKKQMETVKLQDIKQEDLQKSEGSQDREEE